jgi:hypothetical protein
MLYRISHVVLALACLGRAQTADTANWTRVDVSTEFFNEGASFADFDKDGKMDVASPPFWYEGPDWKVSHRFRAGKALRGDSGVYGGGSDAPWQCETYDFNNDGSPDILTNMGPCCGTVEWYQNPGTPRTATANWTARTMLTGLGCESPHLGNVTGDAKPEYIVMQNNKVGVGEANAANLTGAWTFRAVSEVRSGNGATAYGINAHGIGAGDVNMDGRIDVFSMHGWYEQPATLGSGEWTLHEAPFSSRPYTGENQGGAHMYAYDIDGDADNDVVSSIQAHAWGLHWIENADGKGGSWKDHMIMNKPEDANLYGGVAFGQVHNLNLADINGDGLLDLVAGNRWGTHGPVPPGNPSMIYWWELKRGAGGATFTPHKIEGNVGAGCQIKVGDMNGDGKPDVVAGGRRGTYVFLNKTPAVGIRSGAPLLSFRKGMSILRSEGTTSGQVLLLRFQQPGFENTLSLFDAAGQERTFALGNRKAGEIVPLSVGRLPAGTYLLRASRDGETETLGPMPIGR